MTTVAIVYHSGFGHTRVQAEAVRDGAASIPGTSVHLVPVEDYEQHWSEIDDAGLLPGNHSTAGSSDDLNRLAAFLGAMAQSNADQGPELVPPLADRRTAEHLGRRVAEAAARWHQPQEALADAVS